MCVNRYLEPCTLHQSAKIAKKPEKRDLTAIILLSWKLVSQRGRQDKLTLKLTFCQNFWLFVKNFDKAVEKFRLQNFRNFENLKIFKIFNLGAVGTFFENSKKREKNRKFRFSAKFFAKSAPSSKKCTFEKWKTPFTYGLKSNTFSKMQLFYSRMHFSLSSDSKSAF